MRSSTATWILLFTNALGLMSAEAFSAPPAKKPAKAPAKPSFPRNRAPEVGDKGMLFAQRAKVIQIIDEKNALVEVEWYVDGFKGVGGVIENTTKEKNELVWLVRPTAGMVDGRLFETEELFEVTGTKRYDSKGGQRTIPLVEFPDDKKNELDGYRTWLSPDGKTAIVAKFREVTGPKKESKVTLEKKDGTTVSHPVSGLSKADQKFVQEQADDKKGNPVSTK